MKQSDHKALWVKWLMISFIALLLLSACQRTESRSVIDSGDEPSPTAVAGRPMMGPGSGMMARHHATVPADYRGLQNSIPADEGSLARGAEIYATQCATCHGAEGLGDGPASAGLDPAPAPLAHTSRMLADDYLFWRISEGGAMQPFNSAMPSWKASLDETARWDVINFLRALSGGQPQPGPVGAQAEAERRAEMLATALEEGLISDEEAALFDDVHTAMDALLAGRPMGPGRMMGTGRMMGAGQDDVLAELVAEGTFTEEQIQAFNDIHDRLLMAGLMQ